MAEELADGEFWLPSEFLADDVFLEEREEEAKKRKDEVESGGGACCLSEFPYGYDLNPSSPVGSVAETESGDDEEQRQRVADLNLQMGRTSPYSALATFNPKVSSAGRPRSTLCTTRSLSISSRGSSNGSSRLSSTPSPPELQRDDAWGMLYAAAGQVPRMKRQEETGEQSFSVRGVLGPPQETAAAAAAASGCHSNPAIAQHQLRVPRFQQLEQRQPQFSAGRGRRSKGRGGYVFGNGRVTGRPWSPPQQRTQTGSGMEAVFLGDGAKRESGGTGVFLPRKAGGGPPEMRRGRACSSVLLPAKVVRALNLDLDEIGARPTHPGGFVLDYDAIRARRAAMLLQKKRQQSLSAQQPVGFDIESRLPPDWTY